MASLWLDSRNAIETDPFEEGAEYDEVVVGAGLTGLTAALLFARAGRRVAVLEARRIGSVTTGNTTAKLTVLQGARLQEVRSHSYRSILEAYVEAQLEGQQWLMRYADDHGIPIQRRDAVSYATSEHGADVIDREYAIARDVDLPVELRKDAGLPFETSRALVLRDQAQFDPMDVLAALAADVRAHGGVIIEDVRVTGAKASKPAKVRTTRGEVLAGHVILATGIPILDRGLYFAKLQPRRSYGLAFDAPGPLPQGMYISVDSPSRTIRTAPGDGPEKLIVGGNGHVVGRAASPKALVDDLEDWTAEHFPGAVRTHAWSAQDYRTPHRVPFVGWLPRGLGRIYLATGYDKWGMTNAVACALTLASDILGGHMPWATTLHRRITTPAAMLSGAYMNAQVAAWYAKGYWKALTERLPEEAADEGQGIVGRDGLRPVARSTVAGVDCSLSAICPHQHGIVTWNDQELSWDCPLHGSRFGADGTLLEGPATVGLRPLE